MAGICSYASDSPQSPYPSIWIARRGQNARSVTDGNARGYGYISHPLTPNSPLCPQLSPLLRAFGQRVYHQKKPLLNGKSHKLVF